MHHLSTWILITDFDKAQALYEHCAENALPITVRVKLVDKDETQFQLYTNMTVNKFIEKMAEYSEIPEEVLSVKLFDNNETKRIE